MIGLENDSASKKKNREWDWDVRSSCRRLTREVRNCSEPTTLCEVDFIPHWHMLNPDPRWISPVNQHAESGVERSVWNDGAHKIYFQVLRFDEWLRSLSVDRDAFPWLKHLGANRHRVSSWHHKSRAGNYSMRKLSALFITYILARRNSYSHTKRWVNMWRRHRRYHTSVRQAYIFNSLRQRNACNPEFSRHSNDHPTGKLKWYCFLLMQAFKPKKGRI